MTTFDQPSIDFDASPSGYHLEPGRCPNVGRACNCPGYCQPKLVRNEPTDFTDLPVAPISGSTLATVDAVSRDERAESDWRRFVMACTHVATADVVDPNAVRDLLAGSIESRRLSAFWCRSTSRKGFLDNTGDWTTNTDTAGRNAGKPLRLRRLRVTS